MAPHRRRRTSEAAPAAVTVTVGGIAAHYFICGYPQLVGGCRADQLHIPSNVPSGRQPVVVTVGTVAVPPAYITIQ